MTQEVIELNEKKNRFRIRIRELREDHGFKSQQSFADKFGVAQSTVGGWESGKREPDFDMVIKLSEFFGTTTDDIIVGTPPTESIYSQDWRWDGRRLREECATRGRDPEDFAEFLKIPVTEYYAYENGTKCPSIPTLVNMANYLCISLDSLVGLSPATDKDHVDGDTLLNLYNCLNETGVLKLRGYLDGLLSSDENRLAPAPTTKTGA